MILKRRLSRHQRNLKKLQSLSRKFQQPQQLHHRGQPKSRRNQLETLHQHNAKKFALKPLLRLLASILSTKDRRLTCTSMTARPIVLPLERNSALRIQKQLSLKLLHKSSNLLNSAQAKIRTASRIASSSSA